MNDLIERQAAIDAVDKNFCKSQRIRDAIVALTSAQPEQRWIPCSERLPFAEYGESQTVLATCEHKTTDYGDGYRWIRELYYNGGNWCFPTGETYSERVIAWMPLPEPYQEVKV